MPASKGVGGTRHWHTNPKGLPGGARKAQAQDESQKRACRPLSPRSQVAGNSARERRDAEAQSDGPAPLSRTQAEAWSRPRFHSGAGRSTIFSSEGSAALKTISKAQNEELALQCFEGFERAFLVSVEAKMLASQRLIEVKPYGIWRCATQPEEVSAP